MRNKKQSDNYNYTNGETLTDGERKSIKSLLNLLEDINKVIKIEENFGNKIKFDETLINNVPKCNILPNTEFSLKEALKNNKMPIRYPFDEKAFFLNDMKTSIIQIKKMIKDKRPKLNLDDEIRKLNIKESNDKKNNTNNTVPDSEVSKEDAETNNTVPDSEVSKEDVEKSKKRLVEMVGDFPRKKEKIEVALLVNNFNEQVVGKFKKLKNKIDEIDKNKKQNQTSKINIQPKTEKEREEAKKAMENKQPIDYNEKISKIIKEALTVQKKESILNKISNQVGKLKNHIIPKKEKRENKENTQGDFSLQKMIKAKDNMLQLGEKLFYLQKVKTEVGKEISKTEEKISYFEKLFKERDNNKDNNENKKPRKSNAVKVGR